MRDLRTTVVLLAAAAVVAAIFAPWYALDFGAGAREAMVQGTGRLPGPLGEFARGLLTVLPDRLVVNGWQVFERTDVVLLCCAFGAGFAALLSRFDIAALAGGAAGDDRGRDARPAGARRRHRLAAMGPVARARRRGHDRRGLTGKPAELSDGCT